jgi:hypothetical protein
MSLRVIFWKSKALPIIFAKNFGGVMLAVAIMWPRTSRTVQPVHSDGLPQSSSLSPANASTSDERSAWIISQVSMALSDARRS